MKTNLINICKKKNNMTLTELSSQLGKSTQYMSELARGNIRLTYDMAVKIASVFNTTPDKLFLPCASNKFGHAFKQVVIK